MEWSQLANALLPAPAGILASFWHSKGWKIWKLPFAELAAVPRFQLLTRSIKAETCKSNPQTTVSPKEKEG